MDFLNFVIAVNKRTGAEIPVDNYPKLFTMDGIVAYLRDEPCAADRH